MSCDCPRCTAARNKHKSYRSLYTQTYSYEEFEEVIKNLPFTTFDLLPKVAKNNSATDNYYIYNPPRIDYNKGEQEFKDGDTDTMATGTAYVQSNRYQPNSRKRYKHLRAMLQRIVKIRGDVLAFDIDQRFGYQDHQLAKYILDMFGGDTYTIDLAHQQLLQEYTGRGRPPGSRNVEKVSVRIDDGVILDDILEQDSKPIDFERIEIEAQDQKNLEQPKGDFVTHPELKEKDFVNSGKLIQVVDALGAAIRKYVDDETNKIQLQAPRIIHLERKELPPLDMGVQHRNFEMLLKVCSASMRSGNRVLPWVYGPAGTGKSTAAEKVSEAFQLPYYSMGKTLAKFEILGFINTSGYQTTEFRKAYETGGVFCADEMDAWSNEATVALNGALANGHCSFADKNVKRHKDFVMITCANTTGSGATIEYVGRAKQDSATLDRFVFVPWPLDEALEDSLVADKDWLRYVRHVRHRVINSGINPKPLITPRAAIHGEALLSTGLDREIVIDMVLRKGLSDAQWKLIA